MPDRTPTNTKNLDRYGSDAIPWSRAHDELAKGESVFFVGTVDSDNRPHVAGVGVAWFDGDLYFTSNLGSLKARNLAANPAATMAASLSGIDLTLEGTVEQVGDTAILERIAGIYRNGSWPAEVAGDALTAPYSAPSAGPPPWHVFRFTFDTVVGVATAEPYGATKWQFAR
jgi:pyridoxamine 5'-phosphate oxidase-like protein